MKIELLEKQYEALTEELLINASDLKNIETLKLKGIDFLNYGNKFKVLRQVNIPSGGIADLITVERNSGKIIMNIFELKKDQINGNTLIQALRYLRDIEQHFLFGYKNKYKLSERYLRYKVDYEFRIHLIGNSLMDGISHLDFITDKVRFYVIDFDSLNGVMYYDYE
jgi:hypothetical protein